MNLGHPQGPFLNVPTQTEIAKDRVASSSLQGCLARSLGGVCHVSVLHLPRGIHAGLDLVARPSLSVFLLLCVSTCSVVTCKTQSPPESHWVSVAATNVLSALSPTGQWLPLF